MFKSLNVLGQKLNECGCEPLTGFFRDGYCNTDHTDRGMHTVCVEVTQEFLEFSKNSGNDLSTPKPEWSFSGLKPGDHWCLCASRWIEAYQNNCAPKIDLASTHEETLAVIPYEILQKFALTYS